MPDRTARGFDGIAAVVLLLFAALLIAPLFRVEYLDNWGSIDSTFLADSRFLAEHWPHPLWQPHWYCGTRFDFIYPPALRYATAALAKFGGLSAARAYHIYTGFVYCLGVAGVYLLARTLRFRRAWAAVAGVAAAILSPSFLLLPGYREDAALHMPQRLNVLLKWGEGPHVSALSLLPFALLFTWRALERGRPASVVLAGVFSSLVVAHNFYGAVALSIFFGLATWSVWVGRRDWAVLRRAVLIAGFAYGLAAWWLTPSYFRITFENLKLVAQPGNAWSRWTALVVLAVFVWITRSRKLAARSVFLSGLALFFTLIVVGHYYAGFRVVGEPHRFVPELDLVLILAITAVLESLSSRRLPMRIAAATVVVAALAVSYPYLTRPWSVIAGDANFRVRPEYQMTGWIAKHLPDARVFATGSLRFWYDVWHDGAQVGGGSDQGMLNGTLPLVQWLVIHDPAPERPVRWLQAMGADAVAVPEPPSSVMFFEYAEPRKFAGVLAPIYDDGGGNTIYRVPRRFAARARVVVTSQIERLGPIPVSNEDGPTIDAYVRVVEEGPDREVELRRDGPESMSVAARLLEGESLLVQETYDPAWRASSGGRRLAVSRDAVGYMVVHAPPGEQTIRLVFELPLECVVGRILTACAVAAAVLWLWFGRRVAES
jgi:hypothetical protein